MRMFRSLPILLLAATAAAGCTTKVKPTLSKAVVEARKGQDVANAAAAACGPLTSPVLVTFGFQEGALTDLSMGAVNDAGQQLACHPEAAAVIVAQADGHGTDAELKALATRRAQAVSAALTARGVPATRIVTQIQGNPPAGDARHLIVQAEGRRW